VIAAAARRAAIFARVPQESVAAVLGAGGATTQLRARLADQEPAILRHAAKIGFDRDEAAGDAALRAAAVAWAAFIHRFGETLPHVLPEDLVLARADAAESASRQPHVHAAVREALGAHAGDDAIVRELGAVIVALDKKARTMPRPPPKVLPAAGQKLLLFLRSLTRSELDDAVTIPRRLNFRTWMFAIGAFFSVYLFTFSVVHVTADTRLCMGHLPDPLHDLVPLDLWWWNISITMYTVVTLGMVGLMFLQAYLGDHRPIVRFGVGLAVMGAVRACTILLVPLCRFGQAAGTARFAETPMASVLGLFDLPWRLFATNDLLFSGHVAEVILFLRVTRSWPRSARLFLWLFQIAQVYALLATRGHYTVDIIVAIPMAYFADRMAVKFLSFVERHRDEVAHGRWRREAQPAVAPPTSPSTSSDGDVTDGRRTATGR
jgi:hypothetical protein